MKIDLLCNDGSPLGVTALSIYGEDGRLGVGGAELALLTMCEAWTNAGYTIRLYNNPDHMGVSSFEQFPIASFDPNENRDVLITFRSVNPMGFDAKGMQVWWSTDQRAVGDFRAFGKRVEKIVTISEFHSLFFNKVYDIENSIVIDLPVRLDDYVTPVEKVPGRCIFTSVPARGLSELKASWPRIKEECPEASLVITSDYRLWGRPHASNDSYRLEWLGHEDVNFLGAIPRRQLVEEEMKAQILTYPCIYDELFCISVAEAQVAGAYPITSDFGAVETTNMGEVIPGDPRDNDWRILFSKRVISALRDSELPDKQEELWIKAIERFNPENIVKQWDEKVFS